MKDVKDNLPLKAYYVITTKNIRKIYTSHKICLFGGQDCSTAIKSHSVRVSALNKISINGHVLNFGHPTHEEWDDVYNNSKYLPKRIGINDASIYYGFCDYHDNSIYAEIEKQQINPDKNQIFLSHFRAYSFAYYRNITAGDALKAIYDAKLPKGHNADDALLTLSSHFQPQEEAYQDLKIKFEQMRSNIVENKIPNLKFLFIRLRSIPGLLCTTLFTPIFDIKGNFLLPLVDPIELSTCQTMSITISIDSIGGFILLAWEDDDQLTIAWVKTFVECDYDLNRLIAVIIGDTDNFYFNPNWWNDLTEPKKKSLMYFASTQFLDMVDESKDHLKLKYEIIADSQDSYIDWKKESVSTF